jgi:hypothetical protein
MSVLYLSTKLVTPHGRLLLVHAVTQSAIKADSMVKGQNSPIIFCTIITNRFFSLSLHIFRSKHQILDELDELHQEHQEQTLTNFFTNQFCINT